MKAIVRLLGDESGAVLAEYALVSAILSVAMVAALVAIAAQCATRLAGTSSGLTSLGSSPP